MDEDPLCTEINNSIPDDAWCVSVKFDQVKHEDYKVENWEYALAKLYVESVGDILWSTAGLHVNGKRKVPHIHYAFIITNPTCKMPPSNPSDHRKRFCKKLEMDQFGPLVSMQFKPIDTTVPKYHSLTYPLKEGYGFRKEYSRAYVAYGKTPMAKNIYEFFLNYGKGIYDVELANNLRRDKSEEKIKNARDRMAEYCIENRSKFNTLREMRLCLDQYIQGLGRHDKPDGKRYVSDCFRIASELGIFLYSDIPYT